MNKNSSSTYKPIPSRKRNRGARSNFHYFKILVLASTCWPLFIVYVFHYSSILTDSDNGQNPNDAPHSISKIRSKFKLILEHFEPVGYGETLPRVAFILVATKDFTNPEEAIEKSINSILRYTDRNRILVICPVFQNGIISNELQSQIQSKYDALDDGTSIHWHGSQQHSHAKQSNHEHSQKIRVIFSKNNTTGVAASRREAAKFINILVKKHEEAGLKSLNEEIITVFVRPDSVIEGKEWLDTVTNALILKHYDKSNRKTKNVNSMPVPRLSEAKTLNNAVSFMTSSSVGEAKSVNLELTAIKSHSSAEEMARSNGESYRTPIVEGAVTAMKLNTFLNLPAKDNLLDTHYAADLEMSWNLWLCADGIDILPTLRATTDPELRTLNEEKLSKLSALRLVSAWTDGDKIIQTQLFENLAKRYYHSKVDDVLRAAAEASSEFTFVSEISSRCKSFEWYTEEINSEMGEDLNLAIEAKRKDTVKQEKEEPQGEQTTPEIALRPLNLEIVSRAQPISLNYVNMTQDLKKDPNRGGIDEEGNYGYVHDEIALRSNPPAFNLENKDKECNVKDSNFEMLTKRVYLDILSHVKAETQASIGDKDRKKIFCTVYTIEKNHGRIPPIRETWAKHCDGFMVASDKTDKSLGTVRIPHEGPEDYHNIWQKVRSIWNYIYDNYYEKYDWFHIGGDDLYVLVENLRLYLESDEIQLAANGGKSLPTGTETEQYPLFLGRRFKEQGNVNRIFNSGGSGYTINKAALKALVVNAFPTCMPHLKTFAEDVMVAQCFRNKLNVFPYDTKDDAGGERYMPFQPALHLTYRIPKGESNDWYVKYSIDIKEGLDHCSPRSVAFHYIKPTLMKRMYAILHGLC